MDRPSSHRLRRGRVSEPGRLYLLTTVVENRAPIFEDFHLARLIAHHFRVAQQMDEAKSLAWVVMPDHFHWLVELRQVTLKTLMRRVKSRSTLDVNKACKRRGRLWQQGFHDRALRQEDDPRAVARYLVANPLRAGLVQGIGDYPHWDAEWL
ncbi:transposase [Pseudomonas sp. GD03860]|uniref:REP-associated tyrosine transposase n=1 Tax=Pseudomonas TaxID=286 RepID=UPI0023631F1D|nr:MULTISPECIES: transposase [Pseudomonas]MDD2056350.1 transposase [Pseudomonas putida]MDH0637281.1 transposase [Pseudomonas sp. GD03860]